MTNTPTFDRNSVVMPSRLRHNRGTDTKFEPGTSVPVNVGLYTVDNAILKYLQTKIKPVVTQDNKQIQVPVIYGSPERWKSVQKDGSIRDRNGKILLPIIMLRRTSIKKNKINSPVNKYQQYIFQTKWNSRNIYDRFAIVNNVTPSKVYHASTVPDHYDMAYEAVIWTEYMEQMNNVVENISFESNEYWGEKNDYKFIARIDGFEHITDLPTNNDRMIRTKFTIDVRAYILPTSALDRDGNRKTTTKLVYSPKKVVFDTEVVTTSP